MNNKKILFTLSFLVFVDAIGAGIIFPIMPELFLSSSYGLISHHGWLYRDMLYGIAFASFPLAGFFGMPILGALSDIFDRRNIMLVGIIGIIIGYFLSAASIYFRSPYMFIFSRFETGFFAGTYIVANALITDISVNTSDKMNNLKWPVLASVLGFIIGPLLSTSVNLTNSYYALTIPFIIAAILAMINFIMIFSLISKNTSASLINNTGVKIFNGLASITFMFKTKSTSTLSYCYGIYQFGFGLFVQSISIFLASSLGYSTTHISLFFAIIAISVSITIIFIQPAIKERIKPKNVVVIFSLLMSSVLFIQGACVSFDFDFSSWFVWLSACAVYMCYPLMSTSYMAIFSDAAGKNNQGKVMGGIGQLYSSSWVTSGVIIGYLVHLHEASILILASTSICLSTLMFVTKKAHHEVN